MDLPFEVEEDDKGSEDSLAQRALIVDDEVVVLDVLTRLLTREPGISVTTAQTAEEAIALLEAEKFDVLITDKNLPGMGGIELIAAAHKLWPMIEAVMITGYASAESVIDALAAGATDYLLKPFDDIRVVKAKIQAAFERRSLRVQHRDAARSTARLAAELLRRGQDAPDAAWTALETRLHEYDRAIREGGTGTVRVVGSAEVAAALVGADVPASIADSSSPELGLAEVVVIETGRGDWHALATHLKDLPPDVVLLSGPEATLSDLLEAIELRLELVGRQGEASLLPDRVKAVLMRRSVARAQADLAKAMATFREALRA